MAWHVKYDSIEPTAGEVIYNHNIGQVPDILIISIKNIPTTACLLIGGGYSERMFNLLRETYTEGEYLGYPTTMLIETGGGISVTNITPNKSMESDGIGSAALIPVRLCTDTKVVLGAEQYVSTLPLEIPLYHASGAGYRITLLWNDGELDCSDIPQTFRTLTTSKNNGSYQIIDLKNIDLSIETPVKYDGYYNIINNTRKVINLSGITINGIKYQDSFVSLFKSEGTYMCYLYNRTFVFYPNDELIVYQGKIEPAQYNYIEEDDL